MLRSGRVEGGVIRVLIVEDEPEVADIIRRAVRSASWSPAVVGTGRGASRDPGWWLLVSAPLVVLLSLGGGYALARQALRPINTLERAAAALDPADLTRRLPVAHRPDEVEVASGGAPAPAVEADSEPGEEGMHLGLPIVRWIAAQHGGRFRYEHLQGINVFGFSIVSHVTATPGGSR